MIRRLPILSCALFVAVFGCDKETAPNTTPSPGVASSMPAPSAADAARPPAADTLAYLVRGAGDVRLQLAGQTVAQPTRVGATYNADDVVITGADGEATVMFAGHNEVTLAPNSTLLIRPDGSMQGQMGAVILRGFARAASGGKGRRLRISTATGTTAELGGAQISVLEVSLDKGLKVQVGEVSLPGADQKSSTMLRQGQTLAIAGLAIGQRATTIDGLAIAKQATHIDGLDIPQQDTSIEGLNVVQQSTRVDGLTVAQQAATVDGLTVAQQAATVDGLTIAQQATTVAGLNVPAATPADADAANATATADDGPAAKGRARTQVFVTARPSAARAKASPQSLLRPVLRRTALFAGGQVQVAQAGWARVRMGRDGQLNLASNAHFVLERTGVDDSHPRYGIDSGASQLVLSPPPGQRALHSVQLAHTVTDIASSVRSASVELAPKDGEGQIYLRFGTAQVGEGPRIEAGQVFSVQNGRLTQPPRPIDAPIAVTPGKAVEIYTRGRALPVAFMAPNTGSSGKLLVELAKDRQFKQVLAAEEVSRPSFGLDALPAAHLFYRINKDPTSVGSIAVIAEAEDACPQCRHANVVQDTGKKTVLYYQETLPAIDLTWKPVTNAQHYNLKIFRDGAFDRPEVDETLTGTTKSLARGQLGEGHYFWLVVATNKAGRNLSEGQTNVLYITYDNVIDKLSIRSPEPGQKISQDSVQTSGYVVLGSKLFVDGAAIDINKQGYFEESLPVKLGKNTLIYRTVGTDGVERYYSRDVTRTK